ncbi:MAG: UDP-glucose/GDP-mannose dehydrogenase family protein [Blastocatellia bacterium]|nr:UDP-glucose/GDP-mannose dehydrogenase family protein [Blastocatellia bacterium]
MHIAIIGTGYVGLVTGACFAEFGVNVTCVDIDEAKIAALNEGRVPIYEPGLNDLIEKNLRAKRIQFTTNLRQAIERSLVIFIAVGTPPKPDGSPDLSQVEQVALQIAPSINSYKVIVTKSTVPTGTGQLIRRVISENAPEGQRFSVASNPEFLREGDAINDFLHPERVVLGSHDPEALAILQDIYSPLSQVGVPIVVTELETAELIKYASNAFLATKISFINEMANLCDVLGCDVQDVARGMGLDSRIGNKFLYPGPGYGGSCFPKDTQALVHLANSCGYDLKIVKSVVDVNERQRTVAMDKIYSLLGENPEGKVAGVLGLAFKPETNDLRESPAMFVVTELLAKGIKVRAADPVAIPEARMLLNGVEFFEDPYETATGCDILILATEWNIYRKLELDRLRQVMRTSLIADLRNIYDPKTVKKFGFSYRGIGRR